MWIAGWGEPGGKWMVTIIYLSATPKPLDGTQTNVCPDKCLPRQMSTRTNVYPDITREWSLSSTYQQHLTLWWVPRQMSPGKRLTRTNVARTNVCPDKCLLGQMSAWTNVYPNKCLPRQMTTWTHVYPDKCLPKLCLPGQKSHVAVDLDHYPDLIT